MSLRHPHRIFSEAYVPGPPPWPAPALPSSSQTFTASSSLQWKESKDPNKRVARLLSHLQRDLRFVYKRKVAWPTEESISFNLSLSEYLTAILRPIADLFNQLHSPKVLKTPMKYVHLDFGESILGATFTAEDFKIRRLTAPIVICLPDSLFDSEGKISSRIEYALSKALEYKPSAPFIIVTNSKDITVFFLPVRNRQAEPLFERVSTTQTSLALRVISTACLNAALPSGYYINVPSPDMEVEDDLILPEGPPKFRQTHEAFRQSKYFTLKIHSVLSEGSERSISTVYRCEIASIDGYPVSSPPLCLKLFDDRFQLLKSLKEDDKLLHEWFDPVVIAEMYALNEAFAYDKLRPVQGTVVPWFYGTHQFTLPDGTVLYGLLMEYIEGRTLDSDFVKKLCPGRQINMIQSCHHVARVLDVADVSQRDWHCSGTTISNRARQTRPCHPE
ncbi:hypothetical protein BDQ12DRAFT_733692 [Crucibulum laeve]|uniref:Protein kinase domain-containing protein n=1 Tax=Crucibulum laeve TaxID=68775 RepID=A0A5C3MJP0_9AGAR|nr:hypothetical protein BDQ12DRAFT_733692 [Crucibulum laeve]